MKAIIGGTTPEGGQFTPTRNTVFISHANPEDNDITGWLALQLARSGYQVWTDMTKLLGGEDFWQEAETAIREGAVKFLYVLTRTSNRKEGALRELSVASAVARSHKLKDFIIPILVDDLPYSDFNIELSRLNAISFRESWATGLAQLLSKLNVDDVPKSIPQAADYVCGWWNKKYGCGRSIIRRKEAHLVNVIRICDMPRCLWRHRVPRKVESLARDLALLPFPAFLDKSSIVTCAPREDIVNLLDPRTEIADSEEVQLPNFTALGNSLLAERAFRLRNQWTRIMDEAWRKCLSTRGLPTYDLAAKTHCFYFTRELLPNEKVSFVRPDNSKSWRAMLGYKTIAKSNRGNQLRWWQFGISLKPLHYPFAGYYVRPHVLFSDNGTDIWDQAERLHSARRSQCKDWWNHDWRDRIIAALTFLSVGSRLTLPLGLKLELELSRDLTTIDSPVSYVGEVVEADQFESYSEEDEDDDANATTPEHEFDADEGGC